jgi:hypothetical protein
MVRAVLFLSILGMLSATSVRAEEPPKYAGTWVKDADGLTLSIAFGKPGELDYKVEAGCNSLTMTCTYTVEKDGLVKVKMVKKTLKGEFPFDPKDGFTFQFKLKVDKNQATLSDFDANENAEAGKGAVEGKYTMKPAK